ncbi:hypothetical protein C8R47DRAFT_1269421 [Mycena vitilis]|nr:hypothetical protein C8R47DRAFT_1269421 [Mycena vitilis]
MSTPQNENAARPSDSQTWRAVPPHLSTGTESEPYMSMASRLAPSTSPAGSATSGEHTTSPSAPTGLSATYEVDAEGRPFYRETSSGLRIDLIDPHGGPVPSRPHSALAQPQDDTDGLRPSTTVSTESDVTPETRSDGATAVHTPGNGTEATTTPESMITALLDSLDTQSLSLHQRGMLQTIHGALLTSRQRLLNTTAVVLDQRKNSYQTHQSLVQFRDETAERFSSFDEVMRSDHADLEKCIRENVQLLTELGESEASMSRILQAMGTSRVRANIRNNPLPEFGTPDTTVIEDVLARDINTALPPRRDGETNDDFYRRASMASNSSRRAAAAFPIPGAREGAHFAPGPIKVTRFEDPGSISSAPRARPYAFGAIPPAHDTGFGHPMSGIDPISGAGKSTIDAMADFGTEAETHLRSIIHRQVGDEFDVPSRIKAPKLDNPRKFSGVNDHTSFIDWVQQLVTWMRAQFMGGIAADGYRITVLKTYLIGTALQWFGDYVETRSGISEIPYDFASVICAMHKRFVTAATAQKATREFDAVKYKPDEGPLKLMDELVDASARMREPMPDFIIRQRFMSLLPESILDILTLHRALSAEYSDIATLRFNSNQVWDVYNLSPNRARSNARGAAVTSTTTPPFKAFNNPRRDIAPRGNPPSSTNPERRITPATSSISAPPKAVTVSTVTLGPNASKRCFKCGVIGHIGTDKICPKYTERPERTRLAAQRIDDTFVDEDHVASHDHQSHDHHGAHGGAEVVDDNWGGSQYDPDDGDEPGRGEDLGDLIDFTESNEARIGAMHLQMYSRRIVPIEEIDESSGHGLPTLPWDHPSVMILESSLSATAGDESIGGDLSLEGESLDVGVDDTVLAGAAERPRTDPLFDRGLLVRDAILSRVQVLLSEVHDRYTPAGDGTVEGLYGLSASIDLDSLQDMRRRDGEEAYTPEELDELHRELLEGHEYPVTNYTSYDQEMFRYRLFEERNHATSLDEWAIIMTLGAAEHCREEGLRVRSMNVGRHMWLSTHTLAHGTDRLITEAAEYVPVINAIRVVRGDIAAVVNTAQAAIAEADSRTNPGVEGRPLYLRYRALEMYEDIVTELAALDAGHAQMLRRLESLQAVIVEEIRSRDPSDETPSDDSEESSDDSDDDPEGSHDGGLSPHNTDSHSPPPSYQSNSTYDPNASPPVEDSETSEEGLSNLEWHDMMVAAAVSANSTVRAELGMSPLDAMYGPPRYEGPGDGRGGHPGGTGPDITILARRLASEYVTSLRESEGGPPHTVGSEYDDRSPAALQWLFGEGDEDADAEWPDLPEIDTAPSCNTATDGASTSHPITIPTPHADDTCTSDVDAVVSSGETECPINGENPEYAVFPLQRIKPDPREDDELLIQSVVRLMGSEDAERCCTYVDHQGAVYTRTTPLPDTHYLSPAMHAAHTAALNEAITERAAEMNCSPVSVRSLLETALEPIGIRERRGFGDYSPQLLPGEAFHERIASLDPDMDDARAMPGFRVQALSRRVEHIASVTRPDSIPRVGISTQPSRQIEMIACLTAELDIGGCKAYMLFDSGSNTDSLTPEFARSSSSKIFKLDEQVVLQLGCVGSKSKICFGARAPVNFGGVTGHAYFDIVNVDRYDGIIGTPFMIRHGLILDFNKRQILFPNGKTIPGLTVMEDLSLVKNRAATVSPSARRN